MSTLASPLRRQLESAIQKARKIAEAGARKALEALAVHEPDPYKHMDEAQRGLRRKLRAQGKQLGDGESQTKRGAYEIKHLVEKTAYDQWHRLLFAQFLLENNLLISPDHGVSVSLDDCEELAPSLGLKDAWAVAARFAAVELPEIFRANDPAGAVELPVEDRKQLVQLVKEFPVAVFTASDSLGWCYQFWQAERKDEVNAAGNKIGADELPAVTQLFTEDYMVDFLLDNTLGAWHAGKVLAANPRLAETAQSEDELRQAVSLPGCPWKYLRFVKVAAASSRSSPEAKSLEGSATWLPAAGTFDGWPKAASALRVLDPCMGSGHFVVAMFERLVALRMAEERLDEKEAVAAVIRDNLFGLELDPRCTQIGAFNLALAAWRRVGHCALPAMNLACSGLAPNTREADWLAIVDAASSRRKNESKKLEASTTFAPINYFRPDEPVANLTGNLPHWRQEGTTYFVTFRCADALPQEKLQQWQEELAQWLAKHPEPHDESTRQEFYERFPKRIQTWLDSGYGECVLRQPAMREIVQSALRHFDGQRYRLQEFVVAANHVHALVTPLGEHLLSDILHSWKSFTANQINQARAKTGTFWQKESFDHIVRSPASLAKFREYIQSHNVAAASVAAASSRSAGQAQSLAGSATISRTPPEEERLEAAATMKLRAGMERLYRLFQNAPVLGSLINPRAGEGDLLVAAFHELQPLLEKALQVEEASSLSPQGQRQDASVVAAASSRSSGEGKSLEGSATMHEMAVTARGLAKAAEILAGQFTLVATNVPYLSVSKHEEFLRDHGQRCYPDSRHDLATMFVERCLPLALTNALVTPQNWLFMPRYKKLRQRCLNDESWHFACKLGPGAFETISGEVVKAALVGISQVRPIPDAVFFGIDASDSPTPAEKAVHLAQGVFVQRNQSEQLHNPDARVIMEDLDSDNLLMVYADSRHGLRTADGFRFLRTFWELPRLDNGWSPEQGTVEQTVDFGGREQVVLWEDGHGALREFADEGLASLQGGDAWGKAGIAVSLMGNLPVTSYAGHFFDNNCAALWPKNSKDLPAIWTFCSSPQFSEQVRIIDQQLKVTSATLLKIPFDLAHWQKVAAEKYPHGLPKPFSSDPTQWLFNGHPVAAASSRTGERQDASATRKSLEGSATVAAASSRSSGEGKSLEGSATLQVAVARLLGYQWPRQTGSSFPDCPALAPDGLEALADADGIVPISPAKGEGPAAERLRELLARAYGKDWNATKHTELLAQVGYAGATLEDWLRNGFFEQHCALFHHRPFIWHIWDGHKNGFSALVNYHKLCGSGFQPLNSPEADLRLEASATLEKLTYAYLGDWIRRQQSAVEAEEAGSDAKLQAARTLQDRLKLILEGEPPYDIFVRWKALSNQAIGWHPDLNDGVRMNIRPFATADILRKRVKIKWDKDRGKEPHRDKKEFPWFWKGSEFTGDRVNDVHLTRDEKGKAK